MKFNVLFTVYLLLGQLNIFGQSTSGAPAEIISISVINGKTSAHESVTFKGDSVARKQLRDSLNAIGNPKGHKELASAAADSVSKMRGLFSNKRGTLGDSVESIQRKYKQLHDTLSSDVRDLNLPTSDSLLALREIGSKNALPKLVYSEAILQSIYDSIGINHLDTLVILARSQKQLNSQELISVLSASIPGERLSQLPTGSLPKVDGEIPRVDLSKVSLKADELPSLPPLSGFTTRFFDRAKLDSLKRLRFKAQRIKVAENSYSEQFKTITAIPKPSFRERAFAEMLLSYFNPPEKEFRILQAAPTLGLNLFANFSVGVGPNLSLSARNGTIDAHIGLRTFMKYTFVDDRLYFQLEDITREMMIQDKDLALTGHSVLGGVGVLIPLFSRLSANINLLYRINNRNLLEGASSPWVFRLGISAFNVRPKKLQRYGR